MPRGEAKAKLIKFLQGGFLLFILLAIIWFPLLLMNIALTIGGIANNPIQVDVKITLGTFEVMFAKNMIILLHWSWFDVV